MWTLVGGDDARDDSQHGEWLDHAETAAVGCSLGERVVALQEQSPVIVDTSDPLDHHRRRVIRVPGTHDVRRARRSVRRSENYLPRCQARKHRFADHAEAAPTAQHPPSELGGAGDGQR